MRAKRHTNTARLSEEEWMQRKVDDYNKTIGDLPYYDCKICKNKGLIEVIVYCDFYKRNVQAMKYCQCMKIRETIERIKKSGLGGVIEDYTFDKFIAKDNWQLSAKSKAMKFAEPVKQEHGKTSWLFIGGQVGSGKTHLCTAVVLDFINAGKTAKYMLWRDDSVELKAIVNNDEAYAKKIDEIKTPDVLYIDDFFKTAKGSLPTPADVSLAFEILNYRYNNQNLITIISSELMVEDILDIDEAVGSRIFQRCKDYRLEIGRDQKRNYRLNG